MEDDDEDTDELLERIERRVRLGNEIEVSELEIDEDK